MKKKSKIILITVLIVLIGIMAGRLLTTEKKELKTIKSEKQLLGIFEGNTSIAKDVLINFATMPFSVLLDMWGRGSVMDSDSYWDGRSRCRSQWIY